MASQEQRAPQSAAILQQLQDLLNVYERKTDDGNVKAARKKACMLAEDLWYDLLEPGDYIDRVIFQVCFHSSTTYFSRG